MKKFLFSLQLLACLSLTAQQVSSSNDRKETKESSSAFQRGDDPLLGGPMTLTQPPTYNYPANVELSSNWTVHGDLSYIYWCVGQDSMDLAITVALAEFAFPTGATIFQDFNYTSGFKAGFGSNLNVDDWVVDLEYTYLRQSTHTSKKAPAVDHTVFGNTFKGEFLFTNWFDNYEYAEGVAAPSFTSKWKVDLDWVDLTFKRPFYQGRRLIVIPSAGLRFSSIRQSLTLKAHKAFQFYPLTLTELDVSHNNSNSWAIGPRGLVDMHWLIGKGFRFQGNMGGGLLFTQFTHVSHSETSLIFPIHFEVDDFNCLRPMVEGNLGIGWGTYLSKNSYHFDFCSTYDFNYLWGQNMMKYLAEVNGVAAGGTADAMYLHGLTVTGCFNF